MIELDVVLPADLRAVAVTAELPALLTLVLDDQGVTRGALSVRMLDDDSLQDLNRTHRGIDEPTDVLSFAAEEGVRFPTLPSGTRELGDIVISVETAARQAVAAGRTLDLELRHLALHGLLHLLGQNHEGLTETHLLRTLEERYLGEGIHDEAPARGGEQG